MSETGKYLYSTANGWWRCAQYFVIASRCLETIDVCLWRMFVLMCVVVCPLQPSSSVNSGCPGPERSILVSFRWACPISSQLTDHWGEPCNRTTTGTSCGSIPQSGQHEESLCFSRFL